MNSFAPLRSPEGARSSAALAHVWGATVSWRVWRRARARVGDEWLLLIHLVRRKVIHRPACGWRRMPSPWKPAACLHASHVKFPQRPPETEEETSSSAGRSSSCHCATCTRNTDLCLSVCVCMCVCDREGDALMTDAVSVWEAA